MKDKEKLEDNIEQGLLALQAELPQVVYAIPGFAGKFLVWVGSDKSHAEFLADGNRPIIEYTLTPHIASVAALTAAGNQLAALLENRDEVMLGEYNALAAWRAAAKEPGDEPRS